MATLNRFLGELMVAGQWADTAHQVATVVGQDKKKRRLEFVSHGGEFITDEFNARSFYGVVDSKVTLYAYLADGTLDYSVDLPLPAQGSMDPRIVIQPTGCWGIYAVGAADFDGTEGGWVYILYGHGVRPESYGPSDTTTTPGFQMSATRARGITYTKTVDYTSCYYIRTGGSAPGTFGFTFSDGVALGFPGSTEAQADYASIRSGCVEDAKAYAATQAAGITSLAMMYDLDVAAQDFPREAHVVAGPVLDPVTGGMETYYWDLYATGSVPASPAITSFAAPLVFSPAAYKLLRINVATGAYDDLTPSGMTTAYGDSDIRNDITLSVPSGTATPNAVVASGKFSAPVAVYPNFLTACTSSILAVGDQAWLGRAAPTASPTTYEELQPYTGHVVTVPGTPEKITEVTFQAGVVLGARHPPLEAFHYTFEPIIGAGTLSIINARHRVSYVHPAYLPSRLLSFASWGQSFDSKWSVPDNRGIGNRYSMVSGNITVDTPFLFANTRRGLTVIAPTEEQPSPPPSQTQFVVPVRDCAGLSRDWRWFQNMYSATPFLSAPAGILHLYLVDPVRGQWKYLGPAKEGTEGYGNYQDTTGSSGPYLPVQRSSRVVNLDGVLACTTVFGSMRPTMVGSNALRNERAGYDGDFPSSSESSVGYNEKVWLVCSNDGTNWVKITPLTLDKNAVEAIVADRAAADPELDSDALREAMRGDRVSLTAGTTLLIGYGPRNLPIASAPCLVRKPVI